MAKMTRKEALKIAVSLIEDEIWNLHNDGYPQDAEDCKKALPILQNMIGQIDKQAARPKTKTRARAENERMAQEFIALIREYGKPVSAKWMTEHIRYCASPQKAVQVAKVAEEWGAIERVTIKKRTYYEYVDTYNPIVR